MGRSPCCFKEGTKRGAWTAAEDKILSDYIKAHGEGKWRSIPRKAGLQRCGKSCRLRWLNYLRPDIKRGNITHDEEDLIIRLHKLLGNRWSLIAGRLPGRTDNEIKNYWNTNLLKRAHGKQSINRSNIGNNRKPRKSEEGPMSPGGGPDEVITEPDQQHKTEDHDSNAVRIPPAAAESDEFSEGISLILASEKEKNMGFLMDFNAGEMMSNTFSETVASDFSKLDDFDIGDLENLTQKYWSGGDCGQACMDSDFGSLGAFLESSDEEWTIS